MLPKGINKTLFWMLSLAALLPACKNKTATEQPLFSLVEDCGIDFRNDVRDTKDDNGFLFRNFYNGGGVAVGDLNNDGLPDVMFTSNQGENKLYLNKGAFRFEDISSKAGLKQDGLWNTGVTFVDINADGWLDIYVCSSGNMQSGRRRNKLYVNQKNETFREEAARYGLDVSGYCTQASFFDYDLDGDLDCFLINNSPIPFSSLDYAGMRDVDVAKWTVDEKFKGGGNHLYRNNLHGSPSTGGGAVKAFTEVTKEAGLHPGLISFGLGVCVSDVNGDGYPDVYVGNDFIEKDYLYINQKNGTFRDELEERIQKISMSSMSADLADINNDGRPEIFTTDMIPDDDYRLKTTGTFDNVDLYRSKQKAGLYHQYVRNCLQLNNGDGTFAEIANYAGVYGTDWSWGALFFDADNDGLADIFVCNGIARDVGDLDFLDFFSNDVYAKMTATGERMEMVELLSHIPSTPLQNRFFKNAGSLSFTDVGAGWGFTQSGFSSSAAYGDLDGDGDLDLVLNKVNGAAAVYRNNAVEKGAKNYIAFQLAGPEGNTHAVGSKILVYRKEKIFCREVSPARGFQASVDYRQVIGLGADAAIDSVAVLWPDGRRSVYQSLKAGKVHGLIYSPGRDALFAASNASLFEPVAASFDKHVEDDYVDFYYERNLPALLSREGPHVAQGDVNGDGREDLYIGGASGQPGQLYLQTGNGTFAKKTEAVFETYKDFEDVAVLFFDADGDKDLDLFLGAGGNNVQKGNRQTEHRLYKNDGAGNFAIDVAAFPSNAANVSVAVSNDYDGDGDQDLFVGARSVPFAYGQTPRSMLYSNGGNGRFTEVTPPVLANVGMVTAALWVDVLGDAGKELVVTGEWMPTRIFVYQSGRFAEMKNTGLDTLSGWWQSLAAADVNNDGKQDLILGNVGENFYLRPATSKPAKLWINDFDGNGLPESFLTQSIGGRDMPVFLKRDVVEQFPALKKENLKHSDYAKKSVQQLFGEDKTAQAEVKVFNHCASVVAVNQGGGRFAIAPLPVPVQLSSVNAICTSDVNGDGKTDLLLGGNLFTFPPQFGRLDASFGHLLLNKGNGNFACVPNKASGISVRGEVKDIRVLQTGNTQQVLFTQNNSYPVLYRLRRQK